jgi:hypothetical protein
MQNTLMFTESQIKELANLKGYMPFRIVFGCIDKATGEFSAYAKTTMHTANKLARQGHHVAIFNRA